MNDSVGIWQDINVTPLFPVIKSLVLEIYERSNKLSIFNIKSPYLV